MPEPRFRAAAPGVMLAEPLDVLTAVYHRPSGTTHLLAEPAPELLAALTEEWLSLPELLAKLSVTYDLAEADAGALAARLSELVEAGLVEAV